MARESNNQYLDVSQSINPRVFASLALLFLLIGFGPLICPKSDVLSVAEINSYTDMNKPIVYAYGRTFKIDQLILNHKSSYGTPSYEFQSLLGQDVSALFYKQNLFDHYCPGLDAPQTDWDNLMNRPKHPIYAHKANDSATGEEKLYLEYMSTR